jgi:hypothetical protein
VRRALLGVGVVLLGSACYFGYSVHRLITGTIPDCYAQWATADMVVVFVTKNDRLPKTWDDLVTVFGEIDVGHTGALSFSQIRERVLVDFDRLAELSRPHSEGEETPRIIATVSGREVHWESAEPNALVHQALIQKQEKR